MAHKGKKGVEAHKQWTMLALCMGYNELAKQAMTLGEKLFCRLSRDRAHKEYLALGGELDVTEPGKIIVTLGTRIPHVNFTAKDVALMREAVITPAEKALLETGRMFAALRDNPEWTEEAVRPLDELSQALRAASRALGKEDETR